MLTRSMARTISILGAGRVGRTLARQLRKRGWRIAAVVSRSRQSARAAVRAIGSGKPFSKITPEAIAADILLVTTPDSAILEAARQLAAVGGKKCRGKIVLHTSGALDHTVLRPLERCGASTGSLHPMQTFSGRGTPQLKGVIFTLEGDRAAVRVAEQITRALGGIPIAIAGKHKPAYHSAGALVAGHGLALVEAATQVLIKIGFARQRAYQALLPLIRQMLDNYERIGPQRAWTGPLSRGDYSTVAKHRKAMRAHPREFQQAYAALSLLGARVLSKKTTVARAALKKALQ
ncbi:MAG TPA: DUF2520 domain-containing protein [Candidatus Limnocylindrales bacterium]|nr:DUF2520 domain-containing protein [Candidatus Limnocylindrales bacterium]